MMRAGIDYVGISTPFYCNDGQGLFLLHKRSQNCRDEQGCWDCGGGQLEFGQTPSESVLREVLEEYGCPGVIQEQLPDYSLFREKDGVKTHWLAIPFLVRVNPSLVKNNDPEKIDEIGWFRTDQLPSPLHSGFARALEMFQYYFDKYR